MKPATAKTVDVKNTDRDRKPRLKKETLRALGFDELEQVRGGNVGPKHPRPIASRHCLE